LDAATVAPALRLQGRKQGRPVQVQRAVAAEACGAQAPRVELHLAEAPTWRRSPESPPHAYPAAERPSMDRAAELAALVVEAMRASREEPTEPPVPLLDLSVPALAAREAPAAPPEAPTATVAEAPSAPRPPTVTALVAVGGGYVLKQGVGGPGDPSLSVEPALEIAPGPRLSLGAWLAWAPEHEVDSAAPQAALRASAWELAAALRAGLRRGPWLLQVGLLGGRQQRRLLATSTQRFEPVEATSGVWLLDLQPEVAFCLWGDHLRLGLLASARVYLGGVEHTWGGETLRAASTTELGLAARATVRL